MYRKLGFKGGLRDFMQKMRFVAFVFFLLFFSHFFSLDQVELDLDEMERLVLEQNPLIREMEEEFGGSKEEIKSRLSKLLPKLDLYYAMYDSSRKLPISNSKSNFLTLIRLTQTVFSARKYYDYKIAKEMSKQFQQLLNEAINESLFRSRVHYYHILADEERLKTAQEHVEILSRLATQMSDRLEIGTSIQFDVNQSLVAVANASKEVYLAQKKLEEDRTQLAHYLGINPTESIVELKEHEIAIQKQPFISERMDSIKAIVKRTLTGPILSKEFYQALQQAIASLFAENILQQWKMDLLEWNPLIATQKTLVGVAEQTLKKHWGEYFPEVHVEGRYGGLNTPFEDFPSRSFTSQKFDRGVGLQMNWILFDGLGRFARVKKAKFQKRSREFALKNIAQGVESDFMTAIANFKEASSLYFSSSASLQLAEQGLVQAQDRLDVGYINIFDYQKALDAYIEARNIYTEAKFRLMEGYYELRYLTGLDIKDREGGENGK